MSRQSALEGAIKGLQLFWIDRLGVVVDAASFDIQRHLPRKLSQDRLWVFFGDLSKGHQNALLELGEPFDNMEQTVDRTAPAYLARRI